jgi:hypothetical protein
VLRFRELAIVKVQAMRNLYSNYHTALHEAFNIRLIVTALILVPAESRSRTASAICSCFFSSGRAVRAAWCRVWSVLERESDLPTDEWRFETRSAAWPGSVLVQKILDIDMECTRGRCVRAAQPSFSRRQ